MAKVQIFVLTLLLFKAIILSFYHAHNIYKSLALFFIFATLIIHRIYDDSLQQKYHKGN